MRERKDNHEVLGQQLSFLAFLSYAAEQLSSKPMKGATRIYDSDVLFVWADPTSDTALRYFRKLLREADDQKAVSIWSSLEYLNEEQPDNVLLMAPEHYQEFISGLASAIADTQRRAQWLERQRRFSEPEDVSDGRVLDMAPGEKLTSSKALEIIATLGKKRFKAKLAAMTRLRGLADRIRNIEQVEENLNNEEGEPLDYIAVSRWPKRTEIDIEEGEEGKEYRRWLEEIKHARGRRGRNRNTDDDTLGKPSPIHPSWNDVFDARVVRSLEIANARLRECGEKHRIVLVTGSPTVHMATSRMPATNNSDREAGYSFGFECVQDVSLRAANLALNEITSSSEALQDRARPAAIPRLSSLLEETAQSLAEIALLARKTLEHEAANGDEDVPDHPSWGLLMELSLWRAFRHQDGTPETAAKWREAEVDTMVRLLLERNEFEDLVEQYREFSDDWGTLFRTEAVEDEVRAIQDETSFNGDQKELLKKLDDMIGEAKREIFESFVSVSYANLLAARPAGQLYRGVPVDLVRNSSLGDLGAGKLFSEIDEKPSVRKIKDHLNHLRTDGGATNHRFFLEYALICTWIFNDWSLASHFAGYARYIAQGSEAAGTSVVSTDELDAALLQIYCERHSLKKAGGLFDLLERLEDLQRAAVSESSSVRILVEKSAIRVAGIAFHKYGGASPASRGDKGIDLTDSRSAFIECKEVYRLISGLEMDEEDYVHAAKLRMALYLLLLLIMESEGLDGNSALITLGSSREDYDSILNTVVEFVNRSSGRHVIVSAEVRSILWTAELLLSDGKVVSEEHRRRAAELRTFTQLVMTAPYDRRRVDYMLQLHEDAG